MNVLGKLKALDKNLSGVVGKGFDQVSDVGGDVARVVLELVEGELADVVRGHAGDAVDETGDLVEILELICWTVLAALRIIWVFPFMMTHRLAMR